VRPRRGRIDGNATGRTVTGIEIEIIEIETATTGTTGAGATAMTGGIEIVGATIATAAAIMATTVAVVTASMVVEDMGTTVTPRPPETRVIRMESIPDPTMLGGGKATILSGPTSTKRATRKLTGRGSCRATSRASSSTAVTIMAATITDALTIGAGCGNRSLKLSFGWFA